MHKHVCNELVEMEVWGQKKMKTEKVVQVSAAQDSHMSRKHTDEKSHYIDNEQTFRNDRDISHESFSLYDKTAQNYEKYPLNGRK